MFQSAPRAFARGDCKAQGWDRLSSAERDAKRHEVLSSLGFDSVRDVDSTEGFDAVKERLEQLADVLNNAPDDAGLRRRIAWRAEQALAKLRQAGYPEKTLESLLKDRFKVVSGVRTIADLPTREILNVSRTLTDRLATWNLRDSFLPAALTLARIAALRGTRLADLISPESAAPGPAQSAFAQPEFPSLQPQLQSPSRHTFF